MSRNDGPMMSAPGIKHRGTKKFINQVTKRKKKAKVSKQASKKNRR